MPILTLLMPLLSKALDFIPNPEQRAKSMGEIIVALQSWDNQQTQINQQEAQNSNLFVSGARPAVLWVCVLALAYQYLFVPFASWGMIIYSTYNPSFKLPPFPVLDDTLWQLMFGLLGMGGLRTFEKLKGVAK